MALVLNPLKLWRLLRHGRGFGIHSPFAYRFITEVLHQPYAYYAYSELPTQRSRLIFRVVLFFAPRRVAVYGPRQWSHAAKLALPKATITPSRPDMVLADVEALSADESRAVTDAVAAGASLMAEHTTSAFETAIKNTLTQGMTFTNDRGTFIAANRNLPRQDFEVGF